MTVGKGGILHVGRNALIHVIDTRLPEGRFWAEDSGKYIAVDNSTGDARTDEFGTKEECMAYLKGEDN